jgi:hypothetical protein
MQIHTLSPIDRSSVLDRACVRVCVYRLGMPARKLSYLLAGKLRTFGL